MKKIVLFFILITLVKVTAVTQEVGTVDSLSLFIEENPYAVCENIIYEGSRVYLSANESDFLINLSIANPQLQMRLLMMPTSIYVDPTGKKKKKYRIILPSAIDVIDEMEMPQPIEEKHEMQNMMPDISPLLYALNKKGAIYIAGKMKVELDFHRFHMELDQENGLINIYLLIPKTHLMADKKLSEMWSLGVSSQNDERMMPPQEHPMPQERFESDGDDSDLNMFLQRDIRSWVNFSIDEVNNINNR